MPIEVSEITVLNDIRERLAALAPEQFDWARRNLKPGPQSDKVVGEVTAIPTRALWVLSVALKAKAQLEEAKAEAATDSIAEDEHRRENALLTELARTGHLLRRGDDDR